jgi:3'(2'), 5'-bisphosphate nucleotidase
MTDNHAQELAIAIEAVRRAAALCRQVQTQIRPDVLEKKDRSPVTVADFGSQALVCKLLAEAFPDDPVIAEEDSASLREEANRPLLGRVTEHVQNLEAAASEPMICQWIDHGGRQQYAERFWTLDPIDGTKGFLRNEQYAVALALVIEGRVELAALACPNLVVRLADGGEQTGAIFHAVRGRGTYLRPLDQPELEAERIAVSPVSETSEARFTESVESGHSSHSEAAQVAERLGITKPPVRMDSQAKYATVAQGAAEIYLRLPTRKDYVEKIWDHAAGALVVGEAGGRVTDIHGKELDFTHGARLETNQGVIVTNGPLHAPVLEAVQAVL